MKQKYFMIVLEDHSRYVSLSNNERYKFILKNSENINMSILKKIDSDFLFESQTRAEMVLDAYHNEILKNSGSLNPNYQAKILNVDLEVIKIEKVKGFLKSFENHITIKPFYPKDKNILDIRDEVNKRIALSKKQKITFYNPDQLFNDLINLEFVKLNYKSRLGRSYHNINHLKSSWKSIPIDYKKNMKEEQVYAWVFHDFIYKIPSNENEEASALAYMIYAKQSKLSIDHGLVKEIILNTEDHNATNKYSNLILDMDILYFGLDYDSFIKARNDIELEYRDHYTKDEFLIGSYLFFIKTLKRKSLFMTPLYKLKYEKKAKENIKKYLRELKEYKDSKC